MVKPAALAAGLLVVAAICVGLVLPARSTATQAVTGQRLAGTILKSKPVAPELSLRDQLGRTISLRSLHGKVVVLTFLSASCRQTCPLVAEKLHRLDESLGPNSSHVALLAVSTAPREDTPAVVRSFSLAHGLYHRWHFLTGTPQALARVWRAYYIYAPPPSLNVDLHTSATYLIDRSGRERVLLTGDPASGDLEGDVRLLAGLPAPLHIAAGPAPEVGHPAPEFALRALDGHTLSLHALRGRFVLLNFWATWCKPCRSEMPLLSRWYRAMRARNVVVVGVDQQEQAANVRSYVRELRVPYPIVLDSDAAAGVRYDVSDLPVSYLIDPRGVVVAVRLGLVDQRYLTGTLERDVQRNA